jgi:F-type H+-transporting ATPase subunit delta
MSVQKQTKQFARQLFKMSFADGRLSAERVTGVLAYIDKARPSDTLTLLRIYQRLITVEVAKGQAVVEHAGAISESALQAIAADLSRRYGRSVTATAKPNPSLIAGLRVRVGDDIYESSVSSQLAALAEAV